MKVIVACLTDGHGKENTFSFLVLYDFCHQETLHCGDYKDGEYKYIGNGWRLCGPWLVPRSPRKAKKRYLLLFHYQPNLMIQ